MRLVTSLITALVAVAMTQSGSATQGAIVSGSVIESHSYEPVPSAVVELLQGGTVLHRVRATTNGEFTLSSVEPGQWTIRAQQLGYLSGVSNAQNIVVTEDQRLEVTLTLTRLATLTGSMVDAMGRPVVGEPVHAYRFSALGRWENEYQVTTDDRGVFTFSALVPGRYIVGSVATVSSVQADLLRDLLVTEDVAAELEDAKLTGLVASSGAAVAIGDSLVVREGSLRPTEDADGARRVPVPTFFPAGSSMDGAIVVDVAGGGAIDDVDLTVSDVGAQSISGTAIGPDGLPLSTVAVHLVAVPAVPTEGARLASTVTGADGGFVFPVVAPGAYVLEVDSLPQRPARTAVRGASIDTGSEDAGYAALSPLDPGNRWPQLHSGPRLWATVPVSVGDQQVRDLVIRVNRGVPLTGTVRFEGTSPPPDALASMPILVQRADGTPSPYLPGRIAADGAFRTPEQKPGQYVIQAPQRGPWALEEVRYRGRDVADQAIEVGSEPLDGFELVFADDLPSVTGTVRTSSGQLVANATVLAFPALPALRTNSGPVPRRVRRVRTDSSGQYAIRSLPEGDYFLVATRVDPGAGWYRPEAVEALIPAAVRLAVTIGTNRVQNLSVAGVRRASEERPQLAAYEHGGPFVPDHEYVDGVSQPSRDTTIVGRVTDSRNEPLEGALVTVALPTNEPVATTSSRRDGTFGPMTLPAGDYRLMSKKAGFVPQEYGARATARPGVVLTLPAGKARSLELSMTAGAVIAGQVIGDNGASLPAVEVSLVPVGESRWLEAFFRANQTGLPRQTTNAAGQFRFYGLPPGTYAVAASPGPSVAAFASTDSVATSSSSPANPRFAGSSEPRAYVQGFHVSARSLATATPVQVGAEEERLFVDVFLSLTPVADASGTVLGDSGEPVAGARLVVFPTEPYAPTTVVRPGPTGAAYSLGGLALGFTDAGGRFVLSSLPAGRYTLVARSEGTTQSWGTQDLFLTSSGLRDIVVRLAPGAAVSGRVVIPEGVVPEPWRLVTVQLRPALDRVGAVTPPAAGIDSEGTFEIRGLPTDSYRLSVDGLPEGWAVRTATAGSTDVVDSVVVIQTGEVLDDVTIEVTNRLGSVAGQVLDSGVESLSAYTIVVFPVERRFWFQGSRRIRAVQPSSDGLYLSRAVPSGRYFLAATIGLYDGEWFDPKFLSRLAEASIEIDVRVGRQTVQDIRVAR
jgi:protocatechuate 3,4-dioxygenase beta subunit